MYRMNRSVTARSACDAAWRTISCRAALASGLASKASIKLKADDGLASDALTAAARCASSSVSSSSLSALGDGVDGEPKLRIHSLSSRTP